MKDRATPTVIRLFAVFLGASLGAVMLMGTVLWLLGFLFGMVINPGAAGWLACIFGAAKAGQRYGSEVGAKPANGSAWAITAGFVAVGIGLFVFVSLAALAIVNPRLIAALRHILTDVAQRELAIMAAVTAGFVLALWIMLRVAFGFGAAQAVRMQTRPGARRAP